MWIEIVLFLLLGVCAVSDGIKKEIPLVPVWAGILFAVLLHVAGAFGEESGRRSFYRCCRGRHSG